MPPFPSEELVAMLVCPQSGQALRPAGPDELEKWTADLPFEAALVTADGTHAYPVRDGFPVIVAAEALRRRTPPDEA
jgi:uncharacterized protein YbaR (Trm112 family)